MNREKFVYFYLIFLLLISTIGIPYTHYAFYLSPLVVFIFWVTKKKRTFSLNRVLVPFYLLIIFGLISLIDYDFNSFKKTYFIFVYVAIFSLLDFSKTDINLKLLAIIFIFISIISFAKLKGINFTSFEYSIINSRSTFENTYAFPLGLLTLYFFVKRDFIFSFILLLFALLFLKRIVILALLVSIIAILIPEKIRKYFVNSYFVTLCVIILLSFTILFSKGLFNEYIFDFTGKAANEISKGRQNMWESTLKILNYNTTDFLFFGVGFGKTITILQKIYHVDRILLHNDLLSLTLEIGYFFTIIFIFLFNWQKKLSNKIISIFMTVIFLTDNVLIYQHVMFTYFLIQSQLIRKDMKGTDKNTSNSKFIV